jgi:ABC-type phosphate/phosphonate transport system permease subunit
MKIAQSIEVPMPTPTGWEDDLKTIQLAELSVLLSVILSFIISLFIVKIVMKRKTHSIFYTLLFSLVFISVFVYPLFLLFEYLRWVYQ